MKKITLILLLLFIKLSAQNKAGYLSDTNQPWGLESNITAMNTVYGMDWTQYDYSTVDANLLFIQDRKFIYLEGGDGSTSMMVNFINNNTVLIESWVASGGVLLISAATNEIYTPYNVGFGITSTLDYVESGEPSDVNHPFYTGSTFTPILNSVYNGSSLAHNVLTGPGLVPIMRGNAGQGIILGEKVHGSGLVIFSGLTTPFFVSYWTPQPLMSNVLYRMISYGVSINTIPTITAIANQSACPSTSVSNVEIAIDDAETPAGDLTLSATSSNQTLLPGANIVFGGSGANRTVSLTPALGENGTSSVVVTVDDGQGGTAISTFIFTVEDNIAPVVLTKNITVQLNAAGSVTVNAADLDNGSTDNCGIASYMLSTGTTGTVCATAGEGGDLNISAPAGSVFTGVTFASYGTPDGSCGSFTEGWCHASNSASIVSSYLIGQNTATIPATNDVFGDPCGGTPKRLYVEATYGPSVASFVASKVFSCADIGTQNVTLMVTDNSGNFAFANAVITVEDKITPVALTKNIIVQLDATGNATIAPADLDNGSTDACGIDLLELDITSFTCVNVGPNTVTLKATDVNGNVATQTAIVTVEDKVVPVVVTKSITVQLDATGNATIAPADIDNGSTDACGIDLLELDITSFTCVNVGPNTVTLKATDVNGNVATQTAIVTVEDKFVPVVATKNITVQLDATGNATITPTDVDNGSTDACGIDLLELDITSFTCANVGPNTVTLKATDVNGNVATQTAIVTVEDKVVPVVVTKNIMVQLDAAGNATITPADVNNGSTDACGIATLALDKTSFS
ncbi:galactose binding lectin-like protein, partial [Flavobacterium limicola]